MAVDIPSYIRIDDPTDGTLEYLKIQLSRCKDSKDANEYQQLIAQTEQTLLKRHRQLVKKK